MEVAREDGPKKPRKRRRVHGFAEEIAISRAARSHVDDLALPRYITESSYIKDGELLKPDMYPGRVKYDSGRKIIAILRAVAIPDCRDEHETLEDVIHEFTLEEARRIDLVGTRVTADHVTYDEKIVLGRCTRQWMRGRSKCVELELYRCDDDAGRAISDIIMTWLVRGLTMSVSLKHVRIPFPDAPMKLSVEISICDVPRRQGANIEDIRYMVDTSPYALPQHVPSAAERRRVGGGGAITIAAS